MFPTSDDAQKTGIPDGTELFGWARLWGASLIAQGASTDVLGNHQDKKTPKR
jgi:hypothetical protein